LTINLYAIDGLSTDALVKYIESKPAHSTFIEVFFFSRIEKSVIMKSISSRVYTDTQFSYSDFLQAVDSSKAGNIQTITVKNKAEQLPNLSGASNIFLIMLEGKTMDENFELLEALETISKNIRPNAMSMLIGYGKSIQRPTRLLQEQNVTATEDQKINSEATGGLLVSLLIALIATFGFIMMANIQTPKSFARRDLVKGRINL